MSEPSQSNPYAPPTAHVEDVPTQTQALGGRGARLGAVIIDSLIQGVLYYALAFSLFPALMPAPDAGFGSLALQLVIGLALFVVLQGYLLATQGQTIGKKLLGLRIVRSSGERATFARIVLLRTLPGWIGALLPFIGAIYALVDMLLIFRESRKCLHDNIADTIVVRA